MSNLSPRWCLCKAGTTITGAYPNISKEVLISYWDWVCNSPCAPCTLKVHVKPMCHGSCTQLAERCNQLWGTKETQTENGFWRGQAKSKSLSEEGPPQRAPQQKPKSHTNTSAPVLLPSGAKAPVVRQGEFTLKEEGLLRLSPQGSCSRNFDSGATTPQRAVITSGYKEKTLPHIWPHSFRPPFMTATLFKTSSCQQTLNKWLAFTLNPVLPSKSLDTFRLYMEAPP